MAHVVGHRKTVNFLKQWAGPESLLSLTFFFWRSGTDLQKSVVGLLRSLLYQLVEDIPDLLLPLLTKHPLPPERYPAWAERKLSELTMFAFEQAARNRKICIFLDGLDEYEGDTDDLFRLIDSITSVHNVKACVSSRPEVQLERRLIQHPYTRMEVFNRQDIEKYVVARFNPYGDHQHFATNIVDEAQGVFLWAALVTRAIILGIENGDDNSILELRLKHTPVEMAALIKHMANSVDLVYTGTLGAYFNILKCHHLGIGDEPTLALIAATTLTSDIISYRDFLTECAKTKQRLSAQSRGLLEIKTVDSEHGHAKDSVWSLSQALRSADASSASIYSIERPDLVSSRSTDAVDDLVQAVQAAEIASVAWLHRSVQDLVFDPGADGVASRFVLHPVPRTIMSLLHARIRLLISAPSNHYPLIVAPTRILDIVESAIQARRKLGDEIDVNIVLDELNEVIGHFQRAELEFRGAQRSILGDMLQCSESIEQKLHAQSMLYLVCMEFGELDYVRSGVERLFRGAQGCWIIARLLYVCCSNLSNTYTQHGRAHNAIDRTKYTELLLFLLRALKARCPQGSHDLENSRMSYRHWQVTTHSWLSVSFDNNMPMSDALLECEVVPSLAVAFWRWTASRFASGLWGGRATVLQHPTIIEIDILATFQRLLGFWNIYIGLRDDTKRQKLKGDTTRQKPQKPPLCILQTSFHAIPGVEVVCPSCCARGRNCSGSDLPQDLGYRIICQKTILKRTCTQSTHTPTTWNDDQHTMIYDLSVPSLVEALHQLSTNDRLDANSAHVVWEKTSVLWDALIADVWANIQGQLDSWQQLFVLACLRSARNQGHMA